MKVDRSISASLITSYFMGVVALNLPEASRVRSEW